MPHRILSEVQLPDFKDRPQKEGDILRTAEKLFMQFGYYRVTVEEICREANVSKVTFYKYFSNKFAVLEDYMSSRLELGMETFNRIRMAEAPLKDKMQAMIAMKEAAVSQFSPVFMHSLMSADTAIVDLMNRWTEMSMASMREFFADAQSKGEIHPDYSVDFLLHIWMVVGADARSEAMMAMYGDDIVKLSKDFMNFLFYGTTGPPRES
ncbi:MAG: TetR/AcrR family transcriptional regulator [Candidatus Marinimicrobia bacterium]|nr:TetR/AcrR family transcriptional regulator [Candidatus Neomarinimicrobiota bacterium]